MRNPVFLAVLFFAALLAAAPQMPNVGATKNFRAPTYRITPQGKMLDMVVSGSDSSNLPGGALLVHNFEVQSFHNGDAHQVQLIVKAPVCDVELGKHAWNDGPVEIYTPTTNLLVQGRGFSFDNTNKFLTLSNEVHTLVLKSALKSSTIAAPKTNSGPSDGGQVVITADFGTFDFQSNVARYLGNVHLVDPQLDMTSRMLTIRFTTNGALQSMLAEEDVVLLTTNNGRATGALGLYYVTNGVEMMRLTNNARWRNGDERAAADEFDYDSGRHLLTANGSVDVAWPVPASAAGAASPGWSVPGASPSRRMRADYAVLQFPPTNGPVESMRARGHVALTNEADRSSAFGEQADYDRGLNRFELAGDPVWKTPSMEVRGGLLTAWLGPQTYFARTNAHLKMLVGGETNAQPGPATQWIHIDSANIEYRTNEARFIDDVTARLVQNGVTQDTLRCPLLDLALSNNNVEAATASGGVRGWTVPDKAGFIKTLACSVLHVHAAPVKGRIESADAHTNVVLEQIATVGIPTTNRLYWDSVTAKFPAVTNKIEEAVAEQNVVLDQFKPLQSTHATSDLAVYHAGVIDDVKLTGRPTARTDKFIISNADYLMLQPGPGRFTAFGHYVIIPLKTNAPVARQP